MTYKKTIATSLLFLSCFNPLSWSKIIDIDAPTWANWERKLDRAFAHINNRKIPGRSIAVIVPNEIRTDVLPMSAFGYKVLMNESLSTLVILMPAPAESSFEGLAMTDLPMVDTSFGTFYVDTRLVEQFQFDKSLAFIDNSLFSPDPKPLLENQLALLKYILGGKTSHVKIVPIYVKLNDVASQIKDIGSSLADRIKDLGLEDKVTFVVVGNLTETQPESRLISTDSQFLTHLRSLDIDGMLNAAKNSDASVFMPDLTTITLGAMIAKWLNGDHSEVLAYSHSGQLVLTKDKINLRSYVSAAMASGPPYPNRILHVNREKLVDVFSELLRSDILSVTRQTCASILDSTAAKPPSLVTPEASRKWPVYVSLYDPDGNLAGQAGSHVAVGPLEESLRQFAFTAVQKAKPALNKDNFSKYVVDVSIPYGFSKVSQSEDLIPQLNGIIMEHEHKKDAFHPDGWRTYPDPHQLLAAICTKLGLKPWDYATDNAKIESFRVLGFNEKEPFQDLGAAARKKKKKKDGEEEDLGGDTGGGGGGGFPF